MLPPGATATGVPIGQPGAPATVDIYLDFQCPVCKAYEEQSGATIDQLVASGAGRCRPACRSARGPGPAGRRRAHLRDCVRSEKYAPWTAALTDDASRAGVNATPTVRVGGKDIDHTD